MATFKLAIQDYLTINEVTKTLKLKELDIEEIKNILLGTPNVPCGTIAVGKDENDNVCNRFLKENKNFISVRPLDGLSDTDYITLMPHKNESDGFFIACFERKE